MKIQGFVSEQGKIRIEFNYLVSISPFWVVWWGGGGGKFPEIKCWNSVSKFKRVYIGWRAVGYPIEKTCLHQC